MVKTSQGVEESMDMDAKIKLFMSNDIEELETEVNKFLSIVMHKGTKIAMNSAQIVIMVEYK
jgi:hypothetical protein